MRRLVAASLVMLSLGAVACGAQPSAQQNSEFISICKASGYTGSDVDKCVKQMEVFEKAKDLTPEELEKLPESEI